MAGTLKTNAIQLGDSATATQNFVWQTNADGTAKLARGVVGSTTQDILTIDVNGKILMPQSYAPIFSAYQSAAQTLVNNGSEQKISLQTITVDSHGWFSTSTFRYTPQLAGYYHIIGSISGAFSTNAYAYSVLYKNTVTEAYGYVNPNTGQYTGLQFSKIVYMNGTTDWLELRGAITGATNNNTNVGANYTYLQGFYLRS